MFYHVHCKILLDILCIFHVDYNGYILDETYYPNEQLILRNILVTVFTFVTLKNKAVYVQFHLELM
jgi:hypothetical protein